VLPDLGPLEAAAVTTLDTYVAGGGGLLTTGGSGLEPGGEVQLEALPATRALAGHAGEEATRSLHVRGPSVVPVVGAFHIMAARLDADTGWPALSRAPYGPPEKCHGHLELAHPGRLSAPYGKGRASMLPWTVGRAYREVGLSAHRDLFVEEALRVGAPQVETELPEQVEIVLGRSAAGQVVHLLNRSGDADQRFVQPLPIRPSRLRIPGGGAGQVEALCAGRTLPAEDGWVTVPEIERFEVLVVRG
jgi:hypothetical protein